MARVILPKISPVVSSIVLAMLVFVGVVTVTVSCSSDSSESAPDIIYGEDDPKLPSDSLVDWVSYATQVSVVMVVSEEELPVPAGLSGEAGGGYVGRSVDLRIDETLWAYPGTDPQTGTISLVANGWIRKGDVTVPFGSLGGERLEVGNTYVMPLVEYGGRWGWLSTDTILLVGSDQRAAVNPERNFNLASQQLHGKNFSEVTEALDQTTPDLVAARYAHLAPVERYHAKLRETTLDSVDPNHVE